MSKINKKPAIILGGIGAFAGAVALGFGIGFGLHTTPAQKQKEIVNNTSELFQNLNLSNVSSEEKKTQFANGVQAWLKKTVTKTEEGKEPVEEEVGKLKNVENILNSLKETFESKITNNELMEVMQAYEGLQSPLDNIQLEILKTVLEKNDVKSGKGLEEVKAILTPAYITKFVKGETLPASQEGQEPEVVLGFADKLKDLKDNEGVKAAINAALEDLDTNEATKGIASLEVVKKAINEYIYGTEEKPSAFDKLSESLKSLDFEELLKKGYHSIYSEIQKPFGELIDGLKAVVSKSNDIIEEEKEAIKNVAGKYLTALQDMLIKSFSNFESELVDLAAVLDVL
ncbi:hypothetical protein FJO69_00805 [[Mycoplasma] falconis]|uniref:Uncharacterized protein n=1 Tax=[Mycoplasma] falconis TaxID=92403 RepID=A0A501XBI9_9BACT|nr:hypothetical protein [[Mycoplasma] falconis]TPE57723.1 hypothetical protein FJO69_00805 [[Mycoplasma] falconis]